MLRPTGTWGALPNDIFQGPSVTLAPNGDVLLVYERSSIFYLWRLNLGNFADETGDYGRVGQMPSGIDVPTAAALDASGELFVADQNELWRINIADPDTEDAFYGLIGGFPAALNNPGGMDFDSNGDLWVVNTDPARSLWKIDPSDPDNTSGGYGLVGGLSFIQTTDGLPQALAIDSGGDIWVLTDPAGANSKMFRVDPTDVTNITAPYGQELTLGFENARGSVLLVREVANFGAWTDIATLPASTYPAGNLAEGDTDTDVGGDTYTVVADGGWRDVTVSIPNTYQEIRLRPALNPNGNAIRQDIAVRSIRSA